MRCSDLLTGKRSAISFILILFIFGLCTFGQEPNVSKAAPKIEKNKASSDKDAARNLTAEQAVEAAIIIYAYPAGREKMLQIRKTEYERGK
ncbi:MAG: hypothetical protein ACRD6X_22115, partial [Pyrinomonadaceae bacterium]